MKIAVTVPARIHLTLVELGLHGYRRNGGIGFALNAPSRHLEFAPAPEFDLDLLGNLGFATHEVDDIRSLLSRTRLNKGFRDSFRLLSARGSGRHVGTGSGTSVTLACLEALFKVNDAQIDEKELIQLSGRGGTSGVGIRTYFTGGFVLDVGRQYDDEPIVSSDDVVTPASIPNVLSQMSTSMPHWPIGILIPDCEPLTIERERAVFESLKTEPLQSSAVHEAAYHSVFGVAAAVLSADYDAFCQAVNAIQKTAWKQREIRAYGTTISDAIGRMLALGCDCVGLSSMGPALFFCPVSWNMFCRCCVPSLPGRWSN